MARDAQIQVRRDTAANWTSANPTLAAGEFGFETDTGKLKCGDGSTVWASLGYINSAGTTTPVPAVKWSSGTVYRNGANAATTSSITVNTTYYLPIYVPNSVTVNEMGFGTGGTWSGTGVVRLGIYNDNNGSPGTVLLDAGTKSQTTAGAIAAITGLSQALTQGIYWLAINLVTAPTTTSVTYAQTGVYLPGLPSSNSTTSTLGGLSYYQTQSVNATSGFATASSPAWAAPSSTIGGPVVYVKTA